MIERKNINQLLNNKKKKIYLNSIKSITKIEREKMNKRIEKNIYLQMRIQTMVGTKSKYLYNGKEKVKQPQCVCVFKHSRSNSNYYFGYTFSSIFHGSSWFLCKI